MRIGIYFCPNKKNERSDQIELARYANRLPGVVSVEILGFRPVRPEGIAARIKSGQIERVVIAGDRPGFFKPAFSTAMQIAGQDPGQVRLASFQSNKTNIHESTRYAEAILVCAAQGIPYALAALPGKGNPVHQATLVIGAGIAGIQTALEIAESGYQVYLVERTGSIGGHMAMFGRTFPTLDCTPCILAHKMVAAGRQERINILTNSELIELSGGPGAYQARICRKPRYVDPVTCVACGSCSQVCPVLVPNEFDANITTRKAIYLPFQQAVPGAFLVDPANCLYIRNGTCGRCARRCAKKCINLEETDETLQLDVGNIVIATGYDLLNAGNIDGYGYGVYPNVLTALEFERLTDDSGPTNGKIVSRVQTFNSLTGLNEWVFDMSSAPPQSVAIIHCVGSRNANYNPYCSRVCCSYALKFAHFVKEKLPGATCYDFYLDMRAFGSGQGNLPERIARDGTFVVRARSARVAEVNGSLLIKSEDVVHNRLIELPVDMVVLAVGVIPAHGTEELCRMLGVDRSPDGWFSQLDYNGNPIDTDRGGIYVAGMCHSPKDIHDTVVQASAAAAGVLRTLSIGRITADSPSISAEAVENRAKKLAELETD